MADDLTDAINEAAQQPAEAQNETGRFKSRPISEMIEADQYGKTATSATRLHRGIRFTKLSPPGAF